MKLSAKSLAPFVVVLTLATLRVATATHASVSLVNNGYEGVVVAISPSVDEVYASEVISSIKKTIGKASEVLFRATRQKAFFRDIKILLPRTWINTPYDQPAVTENFQDSDIRVDKSNLVYGNQPYTEQPGGCGDPGRFIHLTPEYLTDDDEASQWGLREKTFVHEWAKLRWGVFDEIGYPGDPRYPLHYLNFSKCSFTLEPNYCANQDLMSCQREYTNSDICQILNGKPDNICGFIPDDNQTATSSLMSHYYLHSVEEFCDNSQTTTHIRDAPNRQNEKCLGSSVWEVIEEHEDFCGGKNPPVNSSTETHFTVLRQEEAKVALVLDYSSSMSSHDRILKLQKAARRWLLHEVATGSSVAVIKFSRKASLVRRLTVITSDANREFLASGITAALGRRTCIGCGLEKAVNDVLDGYKNTVIILVTDGKENQDPSMEDVMDSVVASGARVVTIAFGESADENVEKLAQRTNGKTFTVKDTDNGGQLDDAFLAALTYQPADPFSESLHKIYESDYRGTKTTLSEQFAVDASLGRDLKFELQTNTHSHVVSRPHLLRPNGTLVDTATFDNASNMYTITVKTAEEGQWSYSVGLSGYSSNYISVAVAAKARTPNTDPIIVNAWSSAGTEGVDATASPVAVYAEVKQGNSPVVGASVKAVICETSSRSASMELELLDNGQGADALAGDGTYSRYVAAYSTVGRYAVKAYVWNDGNALVNNGFPSTRRQHRSYRASTFKRSISVQAPRTYCCGSFVPLDIDTAIAPGNFTRVTPGGSFQVTNIPKSGDVFGPSRVTDLRMTLTPANLTLTWTATGDDFDAGTVFGYEIRVASNIKGLREATFDHGKNTVLLEVERSRDFSNLLVEAGRKVTLTLDYEEDIKYDSPYMVALKAVDEADNWSPVSNVATVMLCSPPRPSH